MSNLVLRHGVAHRCRRHCRIIPLLAVGIELFSTSARFSCCCC
eukprot:CCRYP_003835-RB/>CCRYP_003835-RB protein AED:0.23 eAED:0.23 QI:44/1/1/1/0/0/2/112/42